MAQHKRINEKTPHGGDFSEIYYFDEKGSPIDEKKASRCVIRECTESGKLLKETWGFCNNQR